MRARLTGMYSLLVNRQGITSSRNNGASLSGPTNSKMSAGFPARQLFKLQGSSILAISGGDLTKWQGDAIVNAANERMLGGGGVDGAIHRAAGRKLLEACYEVQPVPNSRGIRCPTGEARITPGFRLDAKFVIHTVGPVYEDAEESAPLLRNAIKNSLLLCKEKGLKSVAFPAISCGVYGYPADQAAEIAIDTMLEYSEGIDLVEFVLFGKDTYNPFVATACEKLDAVREADVEATPDGSDAVPGAGVEDEATKDDCAPDAAAEPYPPNCKSCSASQKLGGDETPEALSEPPLGEGQDATTAKPSAKETCGLDGPVEGSANELMPQDERLGGIRGESMSQPCLEAAKGEGREGGAHIPTGENVLGRKRSAGQNA